MQRAVELKIITDYAMVACLYDGINNRERNAVSAICTVAKKHGCKRIIIYHTYYQAKENNAVRFHDEW